mmetsp:Transcript_15880/g.28816  ORF Transcript_15880/g.28816 Transcript_15880/m.28816 type:complete len:118 (+) Transcript_15880:176-529(+)|eukprot:CAMPEP_0201868318 /NCGR_PEP_ID=MMETSP0902-20130614/2256_1 /ASSEMBLY_ACC=CAM_ASM_000551 /TAXON_ID=420261 /ORGANISM="Thalassiosira antarctica, Strain CCMP982" /LENGTH=117 /DNA_ID=CAMNT_0048393649 /DNA_START=186 /DNA_END=539 /DNA_ORIENTATION=+
MESPQQDHQQEPTIVGGGQRTRDRFSKLLFLRQLSEHEDQKKSISISDTRRACLRQSSLPTLPTTLSSSSNSNSATSCNSTGSKTSQSSAQSSIQSSWEEREGNRKRQMGPNPFAFF